MEKKYIERLNKLAAGMADNDLDMYIIPMDDFHGSEYIGDYFKTVAYISGFTGSAGTVVVERKEGASYEARLWTDGRYFLQAEEELKKSGMILMKMGVKDVPYVSEYAAGAVKEFVLSAMKGQTTETVRGNTDLGTKTVCCEGKAGNVPVSEPDTEDGSYAEQAGRSTGFRKYRIGFDGRCVSAATYKELKGKIEKELETVAFGNDADNEDNFGILNSVSGKAVEKTVSGNTAGLEIAAGNTSEKNAINTNACEQELRKSFEFFTGPEFDLLDEIWKKDEKDPRPALASGPIWELRSNFTGRTRAEKLAALREKMTEKKAEFFIVSALDEIAWLFNFRGSDIDFNPVFLSYAIVGMNSSRLYLNTGDYPRRVLTPMIFEGGAVESSLGGVKASSENETGSFAKRPQDEEEKIFALPYSEFFSDLGRLAEKGLRIWYDPAKVSCEIERVLIEGGRQFGREKNVSDFGQKPDEKNVSEGEDKDSFMKNSPSELDAAEKNLIKETSPIELSKAIKNEAEIANMRQAHIYDGVALTKLIYWLKTKVRAGLEDASELSVADKLVELRSRQSSYLGESFAPIVAFKDHGAIIHYEADSASSKTIYGSLPLSAGDGSSDNSGADNSFENAKNKSSMLGKKPAADAASADFLLMDTGGHYLEGTTDVTRTIVMGAAASEEEKRDYTAVLQGNLRLADAIFTKGTSGARIDIIAREPLYRIGRDYNHGTGHGVGYLLNVHEGPQNISLRGNRNAGFEPGMITSDEPGVYITGKYGIRLESMVLCKEMYKNAFGEFLGFETLTMVPFDPEAIDFDMLDEKDKMLLADYHRRVYKTISPYLDEDERAWLSEICRTD